MRKVTSIVLALSLALAAVACGGKSHGSTTPTGPAPGGDTGGTTYGGATYGGDTTPAGATADPCGGGE